MLLFAQIPHSLSTLSSVESSRISGSFCYEHIGWSWSMRNAQSKSLTASRRCFLEKISGDGPKKVSQDGWAYMPCWSKLIQVDHLFSDFSPLIGSPEFTFWWWRPGWGIVIFITGNLLVDDNANPLKFGTRFAKTRDLWSWKRLSYRFKEQLRSCSSFGMFWGWLMTHWRAWRKNLEFG